MEGKGHLNVNNVEKVLSRRYIFRHIKAYIQERDHLHVINVEWSSVWKVTSSSILQLTQWRNLSHAFSVARILNRKAISKFMKANMLTQMLVLAAINVGSVFTLNVISIYTVLFTFHRNLSPEQHNKSFSQEQDLQSPQGIHKGEILSC